MKKSEIKNVIKDIKKSVQDFKNNYKELLKQPLEYIDKMINIEFDNNMDLQVKWDDMKEKAIKGIILNSGYIFSIDEDFDYLKDELKNSILEATKEKSGQIQEQYYDPLEEMTKYFKIEGMDSVEDIEDMIGNLEYALDEYFIKY